MAVVGISAASGIRVKLVDLAAWAVALFVFTIPIEEIVAIPGVGSAARLAGLIALPLGLVALVGNGRVRFQRPLLFVVVAAVFVAWNATTFFWSFEPSATVREVVRYAQLLVFAWLMAEFCREWRKLLLVMQAFVLGNYVSFTITAFNVLVAGSGFRDTGPFNANEFSIVQALAIPMAALLISERRNGWMQIVNVAYPFVATFGVVLSASRSGLIVCLLALTIMPFALARIGPLRRWALTAVAMAAVAFGFFWAPQAFPDLYRNIERLQGTGTEITTGTLTGRTEIWSETMTVFAESPLVGIGSGATRYALADTAIGRVKAVHNAYLSVAASTGLIGLLLFVGMLGLAVGAAFLAAPAHRPFMIVLALAQLVAMVPGNSEARKDTWFVLALLSLQRPVIVSLDRPGLDRA